MDTIERLNIREIKNVVYSPEFNGIESVWSKMKKEFRAQLLKMKIEKRELNLEEMVLSIAEGLDPRFMRACALDGFRRLEEAAN